MKSDPPFPVFMYFGGVAIQIGWFTKDGPVEIDPPMQVVDDVLEIMEKQFR